LKRPQSEMSRSILLFPKTSFSRQLHSRLVLSRLSARDRPFFNARCNIYISRLCYDASVRLSVRLSVTFVHCGHRVQWIPDIFACLDRWMSLLLIDNASPGLSDGMMPGFLAKAVKIAIHKLIMLTTLVFLPRFL